MKTIFRIAAIAFVAAAVVVSSASATSPVNVWAFAYIAAILVGAIVFAIFSLDNYDQPKKQ